MIIINDIEKSFARNKVLKGIDLEVTSGIVLAVLGPNGSGKTTLIKSILGMVLPAKGSIEVDGKRIGKDGLYRSKIDYLPQIARFPENLKVRELIDMVKDIRGQESHEEALIERFGLEEFMNIKVSHLSGGTRQKVNIVLCFMFDNNILILDEPTAGLDPVALIRLKELIREERSKGKIILLTTHIMNVVEDLADEIVFLLEGKIFFKGTLTALNEFTGESKLEHSIAMILETKSKELKEVISIAI